MFMALHSFGLYRAFGFDFLPDVPTGSQAVSGWPTAPR